MSMAGPCAAALEQKAVCETRWKMVRFFVLKKKKLKRSVDLHTDCPFWFSRCPRRENYICCVARLWGIFPFLHQYQQS